MLPCLMSAVHHISPFAMAICIMNAKVSGLMVGLNVWGMGSPALSIFAATCCASGLVLVW